MRQIRVMTVFGTRPEAIKLAPVIQSLEKDERFYSQVVVTAQHREMLDQALSLFGIHPHVDLNLMTENQSLADLSASIFRGLDGVLTNQQPDWLLVQGDTTTVMVAGLCAYYHKVKIGHVEAGLRTGDKWAPFPEEINRRVASVVADLHFAPTDWARENLLREGIPDEIIRITGNTIIDAQQQVLKLPIPEETRLLLEEKDILSGKKALIMVTAHRRENFGAPILSICRALKSLAEDLRTEIEVIYPVHLNPNIQDPVYEHLSGIPNLTLLPPLDYLPLTHLLKNAHLVLTDSGGIQEEATGLGVPCLVLRDVTERPEGMEAGVLRLVGTDSNAIITETKRLLSDPSAYQQMARAANPYGDGQAAGRIVRELAAF
jgi:UDP-N-acetylglucosamine 2-epimerase (non-hydrolysing)